MLSPAQMEVAPVSSPLALALTVDLLFLSGGVSCLVCFFFLALIYSHLGGANHSAGGRDRDELRRRFLPKYLEYQH